MKIYCIFIRYFLLSLFVIFILNHVAADENPSLISYYSPIGWDGKIMAKDEKTGKTWEVYASDEWQPLFPTVSPDGKKIAFWQIEIRWFENQYDEQKLIDLKVGNARLSVFDIKTKELIVAIPSSISTTYSNIAGPPSWSLDSQKIIISAGLNYNGKKQVNIFIVDSDGNNLHPVFENNKFATDTVWITKDTIAYKMGIKNLHGDIVCIYNLISKEEMEIYRGPYIHEGINVSHDRKKLILDKIIEIDLESGEKKDLTLKVAPGLKIKADSRKAWEIDEKSLPKVTPAEFVASGDGLTVSDMKNKLMWPVNPQKTGLKYYTWEEAKKVCEDLVYAGYDDWRLPSLKDLRSLLDPVSYDENIFSCNKKGIFWSSTPFENNDEMVWSVIPETGELHLIYKSNMVITMPVRSIK